MDQQFREGADYILKILLSLPDKETLSSDAYQLDSYLRDHAKQLFDFIENDFTSRIIYQNFSSSPSATHSRVTYYLGVFQHGKEDIKKFLYAGGYNRYTNRLEYIKELQNPKTIQPTTIDNSTHFHGPVSDSNIVQLRDNASASPIQQTISNTTATTNSKRSPIEIGSWIAGIIAAIITIFEIIKKYYH